MFIWQRVGLTEHGQPAKTERLPVGVDGQDPPLAAVERVHRRNAQHTHALILSDHQAIT